jgi:hypothetical protein
VLGASHHSAFSNCTIQDDTAVLPLPAGLEETFIINVDVNEEDHWSKEYLDSLFTLSEYKADVLVYIAGYIQRAIVKKENCVDCKLYLSNMKVVQSSKILDIKNQGPLCIPSPDVVKIVKVAHSLAEKRMCLPDLLTEKNIVHKLTIKSIGILNSLHPNLLHGLGEHAESCPVTSNHRMKIMMKICSTYISVVFHHFCKQQNNKDAKIRRLYSKLILFKTQ